jgi:two-component system, NarL family, sensor histidine kinase DegS
MGKPTLPIYDQTDHGIRILEEERRRIARDLHDGPTQALVNVSMKLDILENMMESNPDMVKNQIEQLHKKVNTVINDIRHLIYDLRPIAVDEVGLVEATKALCMQHEKNLNIPVIVRVEDGFELLAFAPAKQISLYRLLQEILSNIEKHARAAHIIVTFSKIEPDFVITVEDDGIGFDPSYIPPRHYGIIGMKERTVYLGGTLDIHSVSGEGSRFVIHVPIRQG